MNAEQKQRAAELLAAWRATAYALHGDRMVALLQELVDAPEAEPVAWMVKNGFVCSMIYQSKKDADNYAADQQKRHDLSGSLASFCVIPLYTAPPAPSVPDGWKLVPYTPTDEMLEQAAYAVNNRPQPSKYEPSATPAIIFWTAMLNYAPEAVFINSCSKPPKLSDERIAELYQAAFGMPINDEYGPTEVHDFARAIEREIFGGEQA